MSVTLSGGRLVLSGDCSLDEAETLFGHLQERPDLTVDLSACERLHGAVLQVLLVCRPKVVGTPLDKFLRVWIIPKLTSLSEEEREIGTRA